MTLQHLHRWRAADGGPAALAAYRDVMARHVGSALACASIEREHTLERAPRATLAVIDATVRAMARR